MKEKNYWSRNYLLLLKGIKKSPLSLEGLWGSSKCFLIASLAQDFKKPFLIIVENVAEAEKFYSDIISFLDWKKVKLFPFKEVLPSEKLKPPASILEERLKILKEISLPQPHNSEIIVAPIQAILPRVVSPLNFKRSKISLSRGDSFKPKKLIKKFLSFGYEPTEVVEKKNGFVLRGGIIDIFPSILPLPLRIEFSGEKIISLRLFDLNSQRALKRINSCEILPKDESKFREDKSIPFLDYLPEKSILFLNEPRRTREEAKKYLGNIALKDKNFYLSWEELISLSLQKSLVYLRTFPAETVGKKFFFRTKSVESIHLPEIFSKSSPFLRGMKTVKIFFSNKGQKERFTQLLKEKKISEKNFQLLSGNLSTGFNFPEFSLTVLTNHEIFSRYQNRRSRPVFKEAIPIANFKDLEKGDYVVHINEGIGRFLGLKRMKNDRKEQEFIALEYAQGNKLYLPLTHITLIQKYIGSTTPPKLSTPGTKTWLKTKEKIALKLRDLASDLLELYSYRKRKKGFSFSEDSAWQKEFEDAFIYEETPDQERAIEEIREDMEKPQPMDRLLCGDVGYGKTEVAMRASFKSVMDSKQVAILVPTTILATQHLSTFKERFAAYPINIEVLSRFKTKAEQKEIIADLKTGRIDIIIGTHRLLGEDITFHNLGLLIIDEEQRFGVIHKEKLRALSKNIDVLTLSATPIPRTLNLSLSGIRDLSQINTSPKERLSVITYVSEYNESLIRNAIRREIGRNGQIYYLHNRTYNIEEKALRLRKLVPELKIGIAHGQMKKKKLESVMLKFIKGEIDLLLATTIIESGLDIPNANTIIIEGAENFGLADLYQLRGRVGRYKERAYAYLFISRETVLGPEAKKRLKAIEEFSTLGSGFKLAIRDLEIRGAGNILGKEQHGFIAAVGFHLYCDLLQKISGKLLGKAQTFPPKPALSYAGYIPESYISSESLRLRLYRRFFSLEREKIPEFSQELRDRFGPLPEAVRKLLEVQ